MTKNLLALLVVATLAACVPAPRKAYSPDEAAKLDELTEIMRVNAQKMDPMFSLEDETSYDDATFSRMRDAAAMMKGTSTALKDRIAKVFPPGFAKYSASLGEGAEKLGAAAEAKDAAAARSAIVSMHDACRSCHTDFR